MYTFSVARVISVMTVMSVILRHDFFLVINEIFIVVIFVSVMSVVTVMMGSIFFIFMAKLKNFEKCTILVFRVLSLL